MHCAGQRIDDALRAFLKNVPAAATADETTRILRQFADGYVAHNPHAGADATYALSLDIMRLSAEPVPLEDFVSAVRASHDEAALNDVVVAHIYFSTRAAPLHAAPDDAGCCIA